jgi:LacI family transcriptional regulator
MADMESVTRASLQDVARAAGISLATVDPVLHGRAGVRTRRGRLAFVLPSGTNSFIAMLNQQVQSIAQWLAERRASAVVQTVDVFAPLVLAQHLRDLQDRFDAVVVMALDHAQVRAAIDDLVVHGTVVVTLVSDVPASRREHFFGIDNVAFGRTRAAQTGTHPHRHLPQGQPAVTPRS